jgi:hypothetical protein
MNSSQTPAVAIGCAVGIVASICGSYLYPFAGMLATARLDTLPVTLGFLLAINAVLLVSGWGPVPVAGAAGTAVLVYGTMGQYAPIQGGSGPGMTSGLLAGLGLGVLFCLPAWCRNARKSGVALEAPVSPELHTVWVVLPTYNEATSLPVLLRELREQLPGATLLVVDDDSPDGTAAAAAEVAARDPRVQVVGRKGKRGLAGAWITGFEIALRGGAEAVVTMDADGSHAAGDAHRLLECLAQPGTDLVIGSRYIRGGRILGWPLRRHLLSRAANAYSRYALELESRDCTSGYRAYDARLLQPLLQRGLPEEAGYALLEVILFRARQRNTGVAEVPITFRERRSGTSKLEWGAVGRYAGLLWRIRGEAEERSQNLGRRAEVR